jgi:PTH2 family peptidyl-tRNA hydrolase
MSEFSYKQVIIMRTDLKMSKGKLAAQAGHAAVSAAEETRKRHPEWWKAWLEEGQRKIAVKAKSEEDLLKLIQKAKTLHLPCALICDRGLTELPPDTVTCVGVGPAPSNQIDKVTGSLPLL